MKKPKETIASIDFQIFNYRLFLIHTTDVELSRKGRKELGDCPTDLKWVDGLHTYVDGEPDGFIFFTKDSSVGTIAHELFHGIWRMFKYIGVKLENETFAYHLGWALDRALHFKQSIKK